MYAPRVIGLVVGVLLTISNSRAAEITFEGNVEVAGIKSARFRLNGNITPGDVDKVKTALAKAGVTYQQDVRRTLMTLDSPGGSYHTGLDLALFFRRQGIATRVRRSESCFSACAIAFLGGTAKPKDPTPPEDNSAIPNQPPDRSIDAGAKLGFHAPYLEVPPSSYTAEIVETAYKSAVIGIARFIAIADHLYVPTAELPRLLKPVRDDLYMVDTVDAVRFLRVDYTDYPLRIRDLPGFTRSMMLNACINRYFHQQRRSNLPGFAEAADTLDEFVLGSRLLANGEDKLALGIRRMGTGSAWFFFAPITKTSDGKSFVWCLFDPDPYSATTFYKSAGTVAELFKDAQGKNGLIPFSSLRDLTIGAGDLVLDMVPPDTKLKDVRARIQAYLRDETVVPPE
jgi:hypothetical protein